MDSASPAPRAPRRMKYGMSSSASATAVRQASGSVRISSSGSFPAGIRITRTLLTTPGAPRQALAASPPRPRGRRHRRAPPHRRIGSRARPGRRQRRPEAGDDVLEAGLVSGHHVGVALHDDRQLLPPDRAPWRGRSRTACGSCRTARSPGELRYLGPSAPGMIRPPRPIGPPGCVADRDDDPATEPVDTPHHGSTDWRARHR